VEKLNPARHLVSAVKKPFKEARGMKQRSPALIGRPAGEGARLVLSGLLSATSGAARRLESERDRDEEALHDFRTLLRRTRSVLKAYRTVLGRRARRFERAIREIARSTSAMRDAEVQLAWLDARAAALPKRAADSIEVLRKQLELERQAGYARVRKKSIPALRAMESDARRWLRSKDAQPTGGSNPESFGRFTASVLRKASGDLAARLDAVRSLSDQVPIHRARIGSKRLRYVLEPLKDEHPLAAEALQRLKELQDGLGEIHDRHVLLHLLGGGSPARSKRAAHARGPAEPLRAAAKSELRQHFADLRRDWLREGAHQLLERIELLASELDSGAAPRPTEHREIERKFLLKRLPERARGARVKEIWQGWIPGERLQERLRRVEQDGRLEFFRTVKLGRGIERIEIEEQAAPSLFQRMWPLTEGRRVLKRRYLVENDGRTWELDEFLDRPLFLAEVELPSADARVSIPRWLATEIEREVTGEDEFVNVNLAR
jgi:CHAD domain-containing protein/CYTH domain-containing protein